MTELRGLLLRKLADRSNPAALAADLPGAPPGTWPTAGVELLDAPDLTRISTKLVSAGITEGWITSEGDRAVMRPGGPPNDRHRVDLDKGIPHVFTHRDTLTICGVRYRVTHQPDKYADPGEDDTPVTDEVYEAGETRVDHFYGLERES